MSIDIEKNNWEPQIVAFCCNWCSYAGADLAGISRLKQPPNMKIIRVPCSGRVNPAFVLRAFQRGADGVLVAGCHPGDCHYSTGNYFTRRRFLVVKRLLEYVGFEPGRFQARWISGSEGQKFADNAWKMVEEIKALGPNQRLISKSNILNYSRDEVLQVNNTIEDIRTVADQLREGSK